MFPLGTKHPQHPLCHLTSPNSPTPRHPATQPPAHLTSTFKPPPNTLLPPYLFCDLLLQTSTCLVSFSHYPSSPSVFLSSSHYRLTSPLPQPRERAPSSQRCTLTRDKTFSPQETSCSETLWLKCVFSWDRERRVSRGV